MNQVQYQNLEKLLKPRHLAIIGGRDAVATPLLGFKTDPASTVGVPIGVPVALFVSDFAPAAPPDPG